MFSKALPAVLFISLAAARAQRVGEALPPWSPGMLDIHRISTGKGDAVLYVFPDGTTMLVDPGATARQGPRVTAQRPDSSRTPGEWVVRYIRRMLPNRSDQSRDYALLTHFHGDHMGDYFPNSRTSASGKYRPTGITEVGEHIPIRGMLDRGWPDYSYPAPLKGSMMENYRAFLDSQSTHDGMEGRAFSARPERPDRSVAGAAGIPGFRSAERGGKR